MNGGAEEKRSKRSPSHGTTRFFLDDGLDHQNIKTTLLDLDDGLLLKIIDNIHEASEIIRVGAVNRRFNRLHFTVGRISATVLSSWWRREKLCTETHLYSFLKDVSRKGGGLLQHLSVTFANSTQAPGVTEYARLHWIKLFSGSLQSLDLTCTRRIFIPDHAFFADLASCTNLVSLRLNLNEAWVSNSSSARLQQVLTACTKLKTMRVEGRFYHRDSLQLVSKSLEKLHLQMLVEETYHYEVSLSLETPALTGMKTLLRIGKLHLRSHSLKVLDMDCLLGPITVETPLNKLEYLSTKESWSPEALGQVLRSIPSRCLDTLMVSFPVTVLPRLFPSLRQLKQLIIILERQEIPKLDVIIPQASGVEVEEIVVVATWRAQREINVASHYNRLYNSVVVLQRSFPLVHKIAVRDGEFLNMLVCDDPWNPYNLATKRAWKALQQEFPGLVTDDPWADALRSRCGRWMEYF